MHRQVYGYLPSRVFVPDGQKDRERDSTENEREREVLSSAATAKGRGLKSAADLEHAARPVVVLYLVVSLAAAQ